MAEKIDLNISPYYDDFNEDKKFHKVLFRAGRPIQARELTQTQSILQNQVERLGNFMFKEGSLVQGAQTDFDLDVFYIKVKSTNPNENGDVNVNDYIASFEGKFLRGQTTGVICKVITTSVETSDDPATLYVKFINQGTDSWNSHNVYGDEILEEVTIDEDGDATLVESNNNYFEVQTESVIEFPVGYASLASIQEGIIYTRGYYVKVDKQIIILEKYSRRPSYKVGLTINETIVTSAEDLSLNDNAQGTSNENAAGADRLKIDLVLSKLSLLETNNLNFIETGRVNGGIIEKKVTEEKLGGIERTLARRTNDTNGDFIVQAFRPSVREHLDDFTNNGFYTPLEGGDEDKFVLQVSPGKAYVKGYEITKVGSTNVPIPKARSTIALPDAGTPVRLGNELLVKNIHGLPDFGNETSTIRELGVLGIYDTAISSGGTPSGNLIGYARVRDIRFNDGDDLNGAFTADAEFKLSLFDIKMFTKITGTTSGATFQVGDRVVGSNSGAVGIVAIQATSGSSEIYLHDVSGVFTTSDSISATTNAAAISTVTAVRSYNVDRARSVAADHESVSGDFTADVVVDDIKSVQGSVSISSGSSTLNGTFGTSFLNELKEGDIVVLTDGQELVISSVTDDDTATIVGTASATFSGNAVKKRASLKRQDETVAIFAYPRDWVDTSTVSRTTVRRQAIVSQSGGEFSVTVSADESIVDETSRTGLTMAVLDGTYAGDVIDPEQVTITDNGTSLTISEKSGGYSITSLGTNDKILVSYTVQKEDPARRNKTLNQARCLLIDGTTAGGVTYGLAYDHKDITLGVSDVYKVRGVFEGVGGSDPITPSATLYDPSTNFINFEKIVGQTSNAHAIIIKYLSNDTTHFYYVNDNRFIEGEYVVGQESSALATINALDAGSPDIKDRYFLDDGQRDGYYDLGKLTLKPNQPTPNNKIMVVFDYFTSSGGQYYDVGSYGNIDYRDIPVYTANRVDLGGLEPDGTYELSDAIDCRPSVGQIIGSSTFSTANPDPTSPLSINDPTNGAQYAPFAYIDGRSFDSSRTGISSTKASPLDTPVDRSSIIGDITFYVPRIDRIFLHKTGAVQVLHGTPSLSPTKPNMLDDSIELFTLRLPAYTKDIERISIKIKDHRRYTMKDIGKINTRLSNLERVTALSLLEKDVQSKQVLDSDGLDRFKSGFLVDNFNSHSKGNLLHPDYKASVDIRKGFLRPTNHTSFIELALNSTISSNYKKTGDLVTLPYTELEYISQPMASRSTNVNPYNVFSYLGDIKLSPQTDTWVETKRLDDKNTTIDNYEVVYNAASEAGLLGETWNDWQLSWVGEPEAVDERVVSDTDGYWTADPAQGGTFVNGETVTQQQVKQQETYTRNGINTSVMEYTTEERHDRLVSVDIIPYIRSRLITVTGYGLKPKTNHFFFFDNKAVDAYVKPASASFSADGTVQYSSVVRTDGNGHFIAYFQIPNNSKMKFNVGTKELKVTSSFYNNPAPASQGYAAYYAQGLLQTNQTEIISTRNGQVITENLQDSKEVDRYEWTTGNTTVKDDETPYPDTSPNPPEDVIEPEPEPEPVDDSGDDETITVVEPNPTITAFGIGSINHTVYSGTSASKGSYAYVSGGTPPYVYNWSISGNASYSASGNNIGLTVTGYGVHSGQISCTVTDSNGETASDTAPFYFNIVEPAAPPAPVTPTLPVGTSTSTSGTVTGPIRSQPVETPPIFVSPRVDEYYDLWYNPMEIQPTPPLTGIGSSYISPFNVSISGIDGQSVLSNLANINRSASRGPTGEMDPLAQSFMIDNAEGVSVTSIEVFFRTKSTSGAPVRLEIRNMVNGYPGQIILPFSSVTLNPSDIEVSEDGSVGTTFTFESPVVLEGYTNYCYVLSSNSDEYEVWVSRMGDKDVVTGQQITEQPSMGSLFKSQNAITWSAEQTDDMKYNLNIANYEVGTVSDVILQNVNVPMKDLRNNPIVTTSGSSRIKVLSTSHGLYDTNSNGLLYGVQGDRKDSVVRIEFASLSGASTETTYTNQTTTGGTGTGLKVDFTTQDIDGTLTVTDLRISHVGQGYAEGDLITVSGFDGVSSSLTFNVRAIDDSLGGIPLDVLLYNFNSVEAIDMDSFNINLTQRLTSWEGNGKLKNGWTALDTTQGGGNKVKCTQNLYYDLMHTVLPSIVPPNTEIRVSAKTTAMKSPEGYIVSGENSYDLRASYRNITLNDNNYMPSPCIVASRKNETEEMATQRSLQIRIQMLTYSPNVSPVLDMDSPGVILNMNRINKIDSSSDVVSGITYVPSTEPEGDNNAMVYITRKVNLENPATSIKVLADNFRPDGTELEFMYKIVRNDEETPLDEIGFEYFNTTGVDDSDTPADGRNFKEYEYTAEELPEFSSFMIKIVGKSENTSKVPLVSSLRILALA